MFINEISAVCVGRTACVKTPSPPSPAPPAKYSIEGKVPGDLLTDLQVCSAVLMSLNQHVGNDALC